MIQLITLASGECALVVNDEVVASGDPDGVFDLNDLASNLAKALSLPITRLTIDPPTDSDWSWEDVLELIPSANDSPASGQPRSSERFFSTTIIVKAVSTDPNLQSASLETLAYELSNNGSSWGYIAARNMIELTAAEAAEEMIAVGSDPALFGLNALDEDQAVGTPRSQ